MSTQNKTFQVELYCKFEITPEEATKLLANPDSHIDIDQWLVKQHPVPYPDDYYNRCNTNRIKDALGKYLAEQKVESYKSLTEVSSNPEAYE